MSMSGAVSLEFGECLVENRSRRRGGYEVSRKRR